MYGYIYRTHFDNGRYLYIGKRKSDVFLAEAYLGSGSRYFQRVKDKYGSTAVVELLEEVQGTQEDLNSREKYYIALYNAVKDPQYLNVACGGDGGNLLAGLSKEDYAKHCEKIRQCLLGRKHSEASKKKMSEASKGKPKSAEHCNSLSENHTSKKPGYVNPNQGKVFSTEYRLKLSEAHKGKQHTQEQKDKIGKSSKGRQVSQETRAKIGAAHKGMKFTDESKLKISVNHADVSGENNPAYGKKFINDGVTNKLVEVLDLAQYLASGWEVGMVKRKGN